MRVYPADADLALHAVAMKKTTFKKQSYVDFELRQLEIFQKVVDLESFSKAGEVVFLAQASVSERIATLEAMVGTRLLDRLGRRVVPTKAGKLLYKHAVLLLQMKRTACLEMQDFLGNKQGEITIGGSTIPGEYILPEMIGLFRKKYPLVKVTLTIADTREIETRVLEGDYELGVVGSKSTHKSLTTRKLWHDELVIALPSDHKWVGRQEISIRELYEEPFILREAGSGTLKIMENYLRLARDKEVGELSVVARLGTSTAVKEGVKAGLGISILSARALDTELKTGVLKALRLKGICMSRNFYVIWDKRRTPSPICQALLDFLVETTREDPKSSP